ncbi:MAG: triose-phosphate isomerase [Patescibacteria group bacterium]
MNKLLVANWKMNPTTAREAIKLAKASNHKNVVICPPFPFLNAVKKNITAASLGAQDVFWESPPAGGGAYTGEVSPAMLKNAGARYVIIGHSERRRYVGETDGMINKKVLATLFAGLKVILCVGEPKAVRKNGLAAAKAFVKKQLLADTRGAHGKLIVAYEPVWAIGSGTPDDPKDTAEMARFIRNLLKSSKIDVVVIYGGSVTSKNIGRIMSYGEIGGALVGGASLHSHEFKTMIQIVSHKK